MYHHQQEQTQGFYVPLELNDGTELDYIARATGIQVVSDETKKRYST